MSARIGDLFWTHVGEGLKGVGLQWWRENRDSLAELGHEEAQEIFEELKAGRTSDAKLAIVSHMSRDEWKAYRNKTTQTLEGVASRRAKLLEALGDLGSNVARKVGEIALSHLPRG